MEEAHLFSLKSLSRLGQVVCCDLCDTVFFEISLYLKLFCHHISKGKHPTTINGNETSRQAFTVNLIVIFFLDNDFPKK